MLKNNCRAYDASYKTHIRPISRLCGLQQIYAFLMCVMIIEDYTRAVKQDFFYNFNRDRFWNALVNYGVAAYICGHTHNHSVINIDGVWQIDAGHARGTADKGARSTFIMFYVMVNGNVWYYTYRLDLETNEYVLTGNGQLM